MTAPVTQVAALYQQAQAQNYVPKPNATVVIPASSSTPQEQPSPTPVIGKTVSIAAPATSVIIGNSPNLLTSSNTIAAPSNSIVPAAAPTTADVLAGATAASALVLNPSTTLKSGAVIAPTAAGQGLTQDQLNQLSTSAYNAYIAAHATTPSLVGQPSQISGQVETYQNHFTGVLGPLGANTIITDPTPTLIGTALPTGYQVLNSPGPLYSLSQVNNVYTGIYPSQGSPSGQKNVSLGVIVDSNFNIYSLQNGVYVQTGQNYITQQNAAVNADNAGWATTLAAGRGSYQPPALNMTAFNAFNAAVSVGNPGVTAATLLQQGGISTSNSAYTTQLNYLTSVLSNPANGASLANSLVSPVVNASTGIINPSIGAIGAGNAAVNSLVSQVLATAPQATISGQFNAISGQGGFNPQGQIVNPYNPGSVDWYNFEINARSFEASINTAANPQSAKNNPNYNQYIQIYQPVTQGTTIPLSLAQQQAIAQVGSNPAYASYLNSLWSGKQVSGGSNSLTFGQASTLSTIQKSSGLSDSVMNQFYGVNMGQLNNFIASVTAQQAAAKTQTSPLIPVPSNYNPFANVPYAPGAIAYPAAAPLPSSEIAGWFASAPILSSIYNFGGQYGKSLIQATKVFDEIPGLSLFYNAGIDTSAFLVGQGSLYGGRLDTQAQQQQASNIYTNYLNRQVITQTGQFVGTQQQYANLVGSQNTAIAMQNIQAGKETQTKAPSTMWIANFGTNVISGINAGGASIENYVNANARVLNIPAAIIPTDIVVGAGKAFLGGITALVTFPIPAVEWAITNPGAFGKYFLSGNAAQIVGQVQYAQQKPAEFVGSLAGMYLFGKAMGAVLDILPIRPAIDTAVIEPAEGGGSTVVGYKGLTINQVLGKGGIEERTALSIGGISETNPGDVIGRLTGSRFLETEPVPMKGKISSFNTVGEAMQNYTEAMAEGNQPYIHATTGTDLITELISKGSADVGASKEGALFFNKDSALLQFGKAGFIRIIDTPEIPPGFNEAVSELRGTGISKGNLKIAQGLIEKNNLVPGIRSLAGVRFKGMLENEYMIPEGSTIYTRSVRYVLGPEGEKIPVVDVSFNRPLIPDIKYIAADAAARIQNMSLYVGTPNPEPSLFDFGEGTQGTIKTYFPKTPLETRIIQNVISKPGANQIGLGLRMAAKSSYGTAELGDVVTAVHTVVKNRDIPNPVGVTEAITQTFIDYGVKLYGSAVQKGVGLENNVISLVRPANDLDVMVKSLATGEQAGESFAYDVTEAINRAAGKEVATLKTSGATPTVMIGDEKLFDIHNENPTNAELLSQGSNPYARKTDYIGLGIKPGKVNLTSEGVETMSYSEQLNRKIMGTSEVTPGINRNIVSKVYEGGPAEFSISGELGPRFGGRMKDIPDTYSGIKANIAIMRSKGGLLNNARANQLEPMVENWLDYWGVNTANVIRENYNNAVLSQGTDIVYDLSSMTKPQPAEVLSYVPAVGSLAPQTPVIKSPNTGISFGETSYMDPDLAINTMAGINSSKILVPSAAAAALGATPIIGNSFYTQDLGSYVNTYSRGALSSNVVGSDLNSKLSTSPYSKSALSLGLPSGMQSLISGGDASALYSGGSFGESLSGAPLPGYPSSYPGYSPTYPGAYSLSPPTYSPDDYSLKSPRSPSSPRSPLSPLSPGFSPRSPFSPPPRLIKTTSLSAAILPPDTSEEARKKWKMPKYYLREIISPEATPRELTGSQKQFQPFYDIIKPGLIAVQKPRSQEYRRRGLEGAAYEEFNGTPIRDLAGLTFHRTATKAQGGPKVMHREQAVDDVITFIQTGTHTKQKETSTHKESTRPRKGSDIVSFIRENDFNLQGNPQPVRRAAPQKTQPTNANGFIQSVRGEQRPQARQERVNAGMNKFNNIIGNTSTTRRKRKNFWE